MKLQEKDTPEHPDSRKEDNSKESAPEEAFYTCRRMEWIFNLQQRHLPVPRASPQSKL